MTPTPAGIAGALSEEERRIISMGDDLRVFLPNRPTKKLVGETFFKKGTLIDSSWQDWQTFEDPNRSDYPHIKRLEAMGLVKLRSHDWVGFAHGEDGDMWQFERTEAGREVAQELQKRD